MDACLTKKPGNEDCTTFTSSPNPAVLHFPSVPQDMPQKASSTTDQTGTFTPVSSSAMESQSIIDSAYASYAASTTTVTTPITTANHRYAQNGGRRIADTDYYVFKLDKQEHKEAWKHYDALKLAIEGLLLEEVAEAGFASFCQLGTRLAIVGKEGEEACLSLVVFCAPAVQSIVRTFFKSAHIMRLLNPRRPNVPKLDVLVIPQSPKSRSNQPSITVKCSDIFSANQPTFCGAPIVLCKQCQESFPENQATFGGIIKVIDQEGRSRLYGMTAGHILEGSSPGNTGGAQADSKISDSSTHQYSSALSWGHDSIGEILNTNDLEDVNLGRAVPTHDWSLFSLRSAKPNKVLQCGSVQVDVNSSISGLSNRLPSGDGSLVSSIILVRGHNALTGRLSNTSARLCVDSVFVDAYMFEVDLGDGMILSLIKFTKFTDPLLTINSSRW
jgi:hypothetical protein